MDPVRIDQLPEVNGSELAARDFQFPTSQSMSERRMTDVQLAQLVATILGIGSVAQASDASGVPYASPVEGFEADDVQAAINAILSAILDEGVAALRTVGTDEGDLPALGAGGLLDLARLGTGSPTAAKFLRGDGAWAEIFAGVGSGQTWQDVAGSRVVGTSYQNTTGRPIMVALTASNTSLNSNIQVSADNSSWITVGRSVGVSSGGQNAFIVPSTWYYRVQAPGGGTTTIGSWAELRS